MAQLFMPDISTIVTSTSSNGDWMPLLLKFCHMKGFYDLPGGRKVHHLAVPRLGGVLFMPAMLVGLCVALLLYTNGQEGIFQGQGNQNGYDEGNDDCYEANL